MSAPTPMIRERRWNAEFLEGDEMRRALSADLGFDRAAREAHAGRVTFVARLLARNEAIPIVALILSHASSRARARAEIGRFDEIYVTTLIEVCEQLKVNGLYQNAREGAIRETTGVDDPCEVPGNPDIRVDTVDRSPEDSARFILAEYEHLGRRARP